MEQNSEELHPTRSWEQISIETTAREARNDRNCGTLSAKMENWLSEQEARTFDQKCINRIYFVMLEEAEFKIKWLNDSDIYNKELRTEIKTLHEKKADQAQQARNAAVEELEKWAKVKKFEIKCYCSDCNEKRELVEELEEKLHSMREEQK